EPRLPARPVLEREREQRMARDQAHHRRLRPAVERVAVDDGERRIVPHRPAELAGPLAQVDVLVIEEEAFVEAAELLEALAANQQTAAGHPRRRLRAD